MNPIRQHPASPGNFTRGRGGAGIDTIVIHVMEGFARGTGAWFADPAAHASAHYGIDVSGGVAQYVPEGDEAWHAGNADYNRRSIGIELEGHSDDAASFTPAMLAALVELVRDVAGRHNIPLDRRRVIGHSEIPDPRHAGLFGGAGHHRDPGVFFPWGSFMQQLQPTS